MRRRFAAWVLATLALAGCINLPPELERELECPAADATDNYGAAGTCSAARAP